MFCFRKKKKNTGKILAIIGIFMAAAAATVGAYFLFTKVLKGKLCKKCTCDTIDGDCCDCDCEEIVDDTCACTCEENAECIED